MNRNLLPLDAIALLALMPVYYRTGWLSPAVSALAIIALGSYLVIGAVIPTRYAGTVKFGIVWLLVAVFVIVPTLSSVILRQLNAPYLYIHDGAIQTEEAIKFVLSGKNPYVEDYLNTPMAQWPYWKPDPMMNPALYHLPYLPFLVVFSAPFYLLAHGTIGWFDERLIYLPMYVLTLILLSRLATKPENRLALLLMVGLCPLLVPFVLEGRNDIFVLFWLVLCLVLLQHRHWALAAIALAFACASKQTAWFVVPFYALYTFWRTSILHAQTRSRYLPMALFAIVFAVIVLPFWLWNPAAFVDDIFSFNAGTTEHAYPIMTLGFGSIAQALGWITDNTSTYPFSLFQLAFGLPAMVLLLRHQFTHNTVGNLLLCGGLLTLVVAFFSRVFNDNHLGYILLLLVIGGLAEVDACSGRTVQGFTTLAGESH